MTGSSPPIQAAALRATLPCYVVNVLARQGEKPRFHWSAATAAARTAGSRTGVPLLPAARSPASRSGPAAARQPGPGLRLRASGGGRGFDPPRRGAAPTGLKSGGAARRQTPPRLTLLAGPRLAAPADRTGPRRPPRPGAALAASGLAAPARRRPAAPPAAPPWPPRPTVPPARWRPGGPAARRPRP